MTTSTPSAFGPKAMALATPPKAPEKDINPAISQEDRVEAQAFRRIPMSAPQAKLATPAIPGFHLHWFNDTPGRIMQAQAASYEFVDPGEIHVNSKDLAGDSAISGSSDLGSRVSVVVGQGEFGEPLRAYLMKIKLEFYQEDQATAQSRVDQIDQAMRQGKHNPTNAQDDRQRYVKTADLRQSFTRSA